MRYVIRESFVVYHDGYLQLEIGNEVNSLRVKYSVNKKCIKVFNERQETLFP